ncbi:MAG: hypothetical protein JWO12_2882 [Frankiales bacterium]|nr:hypothetical protein [Frankiales bacterium]
MNSPTAGRRAIASLAALGLLTFSGACSTGTAAHTAAQVSTPSPSRTTGAAARPRVPATWPLSGMPAAAPTTAPALSVKVDNAPGARPQSGLNDADLVFECPVEGGLSRFLAVFHSHSSSKIGPIRSARPVDGALLRALNGGLFAYSGAASGEIAPARAYSKATLISNDADPRPFYRSSARRAPENVYASVASLRGEGGRLGPSRPAPPQLFTFGALTAGATPARSVAVVIGSAARAQWTWVGGSYVRKENGSAHLLADGSQVSAVNVVILRVHVMGSGIRDAAGNEDPFVLAYGNGAMQVFRNGVVEAGTWRRASVAAPFRFVASNGRSLTLAPGRTWVELVPMNGAVSVH